MGEVIKAYKGFNKDMTCRGFQYEEGKEYETENAEACSVGFHACEHPLDCFGYYSPNESVYHIVEQSGDISKANDDTKVASTKIKIGAALNIAGLVKASIEHVNARVDKTKKSNERCGASSATGDYGASSATGNCGASSATGYKGASSADHENAIATSWGPEGKAKGVKGSFLVLAEWKSNGGNYWNESTWTFVGAKMVRVDGKEVKENTWYSLINGEITEV